MKNISGMAEHWALLTPILFWYYFMVRIAQNCFHFNSEPKDNKAQWVVIIALIRIYLLHAYLILQTLVV